MSVLRFDNVSKHFAGGHQALVDVSFEVAAGEMLFVTGHSGAGKSTIGAAVAKELGVPFVELDELIVREAQPQSQNGFKIELARRAIVRSPLDRIGYGGYLSLAVEHPDFIDRVEQIVAEFRSIHERSAGLRPLTPGFKVAVVNSFVLKAELGKAAAED